MNANQLPGMIKKVPYNIADGDPEMRIEVEKRRIKHTDRRWYNILRFFIDGTNPGITAVLDNTMLDRHQWVFFDGILVYDMHEVAGDIDDYRLFINAEIGRMRGRAMKWAIELLPHSHYRWYRDAEYLKNTSSWLDRQRGTYMKPAPKEKLKECPIDIDEFLAGVELREIEDEERMNEESNKKESLFGL